MTQTPHEPFTGTMLLRALIKALFLFVVFNLVYGVVQPARNGLFPSLYNIVFPGRERFQKGYEFDPYRLLNDHIISQATADTYNIVMLGSSEIWGSRSTPTESIPTYLDKVGMVAADGRPVRVYNLAYPFPYAFKDLVVLEAAVEKQIPMDLVILSTFDVTLSMQWAPHVVSSANLALETSVIKHYGLPAKYFDPESTNRDDIGPVFVPEWQDRDALSAWASMQMRGLLWSFTGDDADEMTITLRNIPPALKKYFPPLTLARVSPENTMLKAFAQFQRERGIPVIILDAPVPVESNEFAPWLHEQTQAVGLPLIECWNVFPELSRFEDYLHITLETHDLYAHILAQHLSDPAFTAIPGLPVQLPATFVAPSQSCAVYPVDNGE